LAEHNDHSFFVVLLPVSTQRIFILFNIVLVSPEIPPNTGNIIRLCANTGCHLHLIEPLGFELSDAKLKRAGLDYREGVDVAVHPTFEDCIKAHSSQRVLIFSKRYRTPYTQISYQRRDFLVFGSETSGLSETIHASVHAEHRLTLPMRPDNRSLNLSNAVAIVVYEAWRQNGFFNSNCSRIKS